MNILIDTNVLLSAALRDRLPERVVRFVATEPICKWFVTPDIHREYIEVLKRPKFGLSEETLQHWSELIDMRSIVVASPHQVVNFPRDPKDILFLAAAITVGANYLITGDRDLLNAKLSITTRIVTIAEFAAEFGIS
jgi:putative PIN family toxin of toxin-antitoxin system